MWTKYNNKVYDMANMNVMRNLDMYDLPPPQNSIEKPNLVENIDDNYGKFYSQLQNFNTKTCYNNTLHNVKKCIKAVKRK